MEVSGLKILKLKTEGKALCIPFLMEREIKNVLSLAPSGIPAGEIPKRRHIAICS
jgi:hypothetical protein